VSDASDSDVDHEPAMFFVNTRGGPLANSKSGVVRK
jgi:hypothetical protein